MPQIIGIELAKIIRKEQEMGNVDRKLKIVLISGDNF
jgi:hypothetical protein